MSTIRFTFKKEERLCSKKLIDQIFEGKKVIHLFPFSIYYQSAATDMAYPAQALFAVSKKNFKKASDRNKVKRLCKESYRKQKHAWYDLLLENQLKALFVIVYNHREHINYSEMEIKLNLAMSKVLAQLIKSNRA